MNIATTLAHTGSEWDTRTGAVSMPIYQSATFRHPALGQSTGFDYSRTANPTRSVLEETCAQLEGGSRACAFGSGLAAIDAVLRLFTVGDRIVVTEDLYGGTFRMFEQLYRRYGIDAVYVDTSDTVLTEAALSDQRVKGLFIELPTNPLLKVSDIQTLAGLAATRGILCIVDNTFLTPVSFRPFAHGADITVYSASKYLAGHNDVIAGLAVARTPELGERLAFFQNAAGGILGPMDSWLLLRGLKTLHLRLQKQQENALQIAEFLDAHPHVMKVYYPGLPTDPGYERMRHHADGFGAMISFEVDTPARVPEILANVRVFLFAESLGGVESLVTFPAVQTHADIDAATRDRLGINDRLLRLSIGIEDAGDLKNDLAAALK